MTNARDNILKRLHQKQPVQPGDVKEYIPQQQWNQEQRIEHFSQHIEAVHAQVFRVQKHNWQQQLFDILSVKSIRCLLLSVTAKSELDSINNPSYAVKLLPYEQTIESCKTDFFNHAEAGLTTTKGAIAETGSLILWPTIDEPRLISLVPPIHIAILDADKIYDTFAQAVKEQQWSKAMPGNALLISGPSKTADIEQVLAYGVHGPKELIVLIRE